MKKIQEVIKNKKQKHVFANEIFFGLFVLSFVLLFSVVSFALTAAKADAATGVNRQINFQGKLVDNNGLNVADSTYTVVFSLYSVSSGGTNVWTETDSVTTKAGIFQVALGATTPLPDNVYFNSDSLYLGIKVGSDVEMTPRIRFTAVPYALNAASLNGVTATQSANGFNLTGGTSSSSTVSFTTAAGALTLQPGVADGLTIDTNGANTLALGNSANVITFGGTNNPTYEFKGTGGVTFDGTTISLANASSSTIQTTGTDTGLTLLSKGAGNITLGQNAGNGDVVISPNAGGQAALLVKDFGSGDLFTASAGATTKFTVDKTGDIIFAGGQTNANSTINSLATTAQNYILPSQGGTFCLSINNCGFATGTNYWQLLTNALSPGNSTYDFLLGGNSTTSARFAFINNSGATTPVASISANNGNYATFLTGNGTIGTTNGQSLTLGTTGNVNFFNANNSINSAGNLTLAGAANLVSETLTGTGNVLNLSGAGATLAFSGNGLAQITTAQNNNLALMPNGSGDVGINVSSGLLGTLDVRGNTATTPGATISGNTTFAEVVVNNSGTGDLFTASKSGASKFVVNNNGNIQFGGTTNFLNTITTTGIFASAQTYALPNAGGTFCLSTNNCGFASGQNYWQLLTNALSPGNSTYDFLLGGNSTSSARFAFINNSGATTPVASISANNGNNATFLAGNGTLGTTNGLSLTLGTTGNINFFNANNVLSSTGNLTLAGTSGINLSGAGADINFTGTGADTITTANNSDFSLMPNGSGHVGINVSSNLLAAFDVHGNAATNAVASFSGATNFAAMVVDNSGSGDIFTASKSGATKFAILSNGNIAWTGISNFLNTLASNTTAAQTWTLPDATGTVCISGQTCSSSGVVGLLQRNAGAVSPAFITDDFLLGSTATASARFAVMNMIGTGTPTASLSAGTSGGAYMTAAGVIETTANQTLTLGGTTTGNILLNPAAGNYVGIDTTTPLATLDVRNALALNGGTVAVASISGQTSFASLVISNSGAGDLFTASSSGLSRFEITQSGAVGIGTRIPQATYLDISENPAATFVPTKDFVDIGNAAGQEPTADGINAEQLTWFAKPATGNMSSDERVNVTNNNTATGGQVNGIRIVAAGAGGAINTDTDGLYIDGLANASRGTNGQNAIEIGTNWDSSIYGQGDLRINAGGNIIFATSSATTRIGIGTTTPLATLDVRGNSATTAIASVSGSTTFAGLVVNNSGTGDLFTASSAGRTKFTVTNSGNIIIGGDIITASASGATNNGSSDFINTLPDQGSMIQNGGFEASTSAGIGFADGWVKSSSSSGSLSIDNTTPASQGNNSLKVTLAAGGAAGLYSSCIPLSASVQQYTIGSETKLSNVAQIPTVRTYIVGYTTKNNCLTNTIPSISAAMGVNLTATSTNWLAYPNGTSTAFAAGTDITWARLELSIQSGSATTMNIDGVRMVPNALTNGLDYAENYPADPNNVPQPGDVVALVASNGASLVTKADQDHQSVLGVVSTKPGYVLDDGSMTNPVPVALAGRVPVNVSTANGSIKAGDFLTASTIPGIAVKATSAGPVIGTVMNDFDCSLTTDIQSLVSGNAICQGQVTMFIKNTYYDPTVLNTADGNYDLLQNADLSVFTASSSAAATASGILSPLYTIQTGAGIAVTSTTVLAQATIANIQAGVVVAKALSTDSLNVTTGNIVIGGQTLHDYTTAIVKQVLSEKGQNISTTVSVNGLEIATQSATLVQNILSQKDLSATVSGMTVNGVLGATTIATKHIAGLIDLGATTVTAASVSAQTISADTIIAKHIAGLDILTTGLQKDDARITALENLVATPSAAPVTVEQPTISPIAGITLLSDTAASASVSGDLHVKGNGLIEGILHVVDTLFTNNIIANGVSEFFGNAIFHSGVTFEKTPTFNSDTAGIAVIKKGTDHVDVTFANDYDQIPVVNASITLNPLTPTPSETPDAMKQRQNDLEKALLAENVRFVITNRTVHGFTILLENPANEDIAFSWLALSVLNPAIFQSASSASPTPADAVSPSPIDMLLPSVIPLSPTAAPTVGETH